MAWEILGVTMESSFSDVVAAIFVNIPHLTLTFLVLLRFFW